MPSDHKLTFGCTIPDVGDLEPGDRLAVVAIVTVRSDKLSLDADDLEQHRYGARVDVAGYSRDKYQLNDLSGRARDLSDAAAGVTRLPLAEQVPQNLPTPEGVHFVESWEAEQPPFAMATVSIGGRPPQDVKLEDLARLELTPARFYSAVAKLKSGATPAEACNGWTSEQTDYLAGFLSTPATSKRAKRTTAPQEETPA